MSEERIQEIKDSINFQYELIVSKVIDKSALLFTNEEQELLEEVERLSNIINELEKYLIKMSDRSWDDNGAYDDVLDKIKELQGSNK